MFNSPLSISHLHTSSSSPFNDPSQLFSQNPPQTSAFNNTPSIPDLDEFPLPTKLTKNSSSNYNGLSTRESSIGVAQPRSRKGSFENEILSSPSFSKEFEIISDDEEIHPRRLPALRPCDFEITLDVIPRNLIMSPDISLVYPCYVSLRLKQDLFTEKPGMDILIMLNIKNHEIFSIIDVFQNVLPHLEDQDRLSLFTTQGDFAKRFPFRVMDEPTKSEFINECRLIKDLHNGHSLNHVLQQSLETIKSRKYENHLSAIFLITDTDEEIALEEIINDANITSQPILFAFGLGQQHNSINLTQICEHFEGKYCYTETFHALEKAMKGSLSQLSDIQAKNVQLNIQTNPFQLTKIYDKNIINEDSTQFYETHRNYISLKKGIDLALEIQVPKCSQPTVSDIKSSINLHLTCENLSHAQDRQVSLEHSKEFNIKVRPTSECEISKQDVDIKSLEKFCQVKMLVRYFQVLMMVNYDLIGSGIQVLNGLKTDFSAFRRFGSSYLKQTMKMIEWTIGELDSSRLKTRDLLMLIQNLIYQAML